MGLVIEKKLSGAGYRMLGDNEEIEELILNILKTENIRYLKAIPFLIYKHKLDINKISKNRLFKEIIAITIKLFSEFNINGILETINKDDYKINKLDYEEFRDEFELQLRNDRKPSFFIEKQKIYAERDLQMYLSQLFTKKEKQIIGRLLEEKPISRTDYEYYSRKTRKKLNSIIGLQDFAKTLYAKTPKYDEDLYNLKKNLEEWIENKSKDNDVSIIEFFLWDDNKISINYKKKMNDQIFNTIIKISLIKNNDILRLLNKYKKHNFR